VTGATGAIGPTLVETLLRAGNRVRVLTRQPVPPSLFSSSIEVISGDITDPHLVAQATEGVETVFHLAALLHIVNPPPTLGAEYERVNVSGTQTVVEAALQSKVKRLVFFSTIAVYGYNNGQVLTEETPPHPDTFYARTKLAAEQPVLSVKRDDGQPLGTVLRLGAVYGARMKGNYRRLTQALARGRFVPMGAGRNRRTLIYDRDVAEAAILAAQHPAAAGRIYNISDGQFHLLNEIIVAICAALGRKPPPFSVPLGPVRLAAGVLEDAARLVGRRSPLGRLTIDKYAEDVAVASQRIQAELGFTPIFDLRTGWQETIRAMRQNGDL
jgi:nucleoside-diphosphate-sugar epimerase